MLDGCAQVVNLIDNTPSEWQSAYVGYARRTYGFDGLGTDSDFVFRVAATNAKGQGEWSPVLKVTTLPDDDDELILADLPRSWHALEAHLYDLLDPMVTRVQAKPHWYKLVMTLRRLQVQIKIAFRLYTLLGSGTDGGKGMDLTQFRRFVSECEVRVPARGVGGKMLSTATVDLIFQRANKPAKALSAEPIIMEESASDMARPPSRKEQNVEHRLLQFEFVHSLLRLASARFDGSFPADDPCPLGSALELLITRCVDPNVSLEVTDGITQLMKDRKVRAVLSKYETPLRAAFDEYASTEELTETTPKELRRSPPKKASAPKTSPSAASPSAAPSAASTASMSLAELLLLLENAALVDDSCSARAVTTFFVKVNLDDELFVRADGVELDHTQLEFEEFTQVMVRVCAEKAGGVRDAFEKTLDTWLGLYGVPALNSAVKKMVAAKAAAR